MVQPIPSTMRTATLDEFGGAVMIGDRPVHAPQAGEALVRIAASPINPSDLLYIAGAYGFRKPLPTIPGFEASGTVVAAGEGVDQTLVGQRVACFAGGEDGTWAEYMRTPAVACIPIPDHIGFEQGAMLVVNPMTAHILVDMASGLRAVVQTAAASALGKMIIRLGMRRNIEVINVVRRNEQVAQLRDMGATHVLNSTAQGFERQLRELCHALDVRLAFEAVGGALTGQIVAAIPNGSRTIVYGALSLQPNSISPAEFIFRDQRVDGFWLVDWFAKAQPEMIAKVVGDVFSFADSDYKTEVRARYPLDHIQTGLSDYIGHMSGGKVLLLP